MKYERYVPREKNKTIDEFESIHLIIKSVLVVFVLPLGFFTNNIKTDLDLLIFAVIPLLLPFLFIIREGIYGQKSLLSLYFDLLNGQLWCSSGINKISLFLLIISNLMSFIALIVLTTRKITF